MRKKQKQHFQIFDASKYRIGIVCAKFNSDITDKILKTALEKLNEYKVKSDSINVRYVAGGVEIPVILQAMAKTKKYDCMLAIGAIIKGKTDHYNYVAKIVADGILRTMMDYNMPVGFAVLTTHNKKLAQARFAIGAEAAEAALQNIKIIKNI
ncbi:MAG: 6,7-dimethyl-8-ribityllumazine synthase [Elusimicrobiales bacterium]|nr:6,7-dimethyl-8-ribityllumazine synthase [Elusimicrobiales bacterium]